MEGDEKDAAKKKAKDKSDELSGDLDATAK